MPPKKPRRISLSDALKELKPLMSKSAFYGDKKAGKPGPRWTMVDKLQIRTGRNGLTLDRRRFERWLSTLEGEPAHEAHPNSSRLGHYSNSNESGAPSYGASVGALYRALEAGAINREQFDRALASIETEVDPMET